MKRKRPLGQNFLIDPHVADQIVDLAGIQQDGQVLEIGPGRGILTGRLLDRAGSLLALEIDPRLCQELQKKFGKNPNIKIIQADALKYDFSAAGEGYQVVSNLPYYAATPILKRMIEFKSHIRDMTLMLQKEVVDRLAAVPETRDYGSLTVFVQYHCRVERVLDVGKECFSPAPKVKSSVIRVIPRETPPVDLTQPSLFFQLVHAAFLHKRKTLRNNLKGLNKHFKMDLQHLENSGIDLSRRGETLSLEDFATLANAVSNQQ
jgi:16S rRNA (adenine1518-N6/adenine1519-N6)-dimethyltransferase